MDVHMHWERSQVPVPVTGPAIVAVAARKGGVGKTTLAYELAAAIGAVLVDLDWERGGATGMWGAAPSGGILGALDGGPGPRYRRAPGRADLVSCHPALGENSWDPEQVADHLEGWARGWDRPVVVDTHPGAGDLAYGAMSAAHLVAVPAVLRERELDALAGMLDEHRGFPLAVLPNMAPPVTPQRQLRRLSELVEGVPVAPAVTYYPWLGRRARRSAVVLTPPSTRSAPAVGELIRVAEFVRERLP